METKLPDLVTAANVEHKVMVIRYRKAWEKLHAKLSSDEQEKVKYAKEHPDRTLPDHTVAQFVKAVILLAQSEERL